MAVCAHLAAAGGRHFLVVCPASVIVNWLNEVASHSTLPAHRLHGPQRDEAIRHWHADGGVAVTTFETPEPAVLTSGSPPRSRHRG
ncbi:SNF2-related protein [Micromonospora sp. CPCC 205546]